MALRLNRYSATLKFAIGGVALRGDARHLMRMTFTWYGNQSTAESCRFGALAVIFPLFERMNIRQIINQHLPADPQAEFDYGTTLSLLMAARLYGPIALSNVAKWAEETGADILWNIAPEKLNDDRLARALDAFFTQRHSILAHLALHVAQEFQVPLNALHYDPTHLLFEGAYEGAEPREGVLDRSGTTERIRSNDQLSPAHITKGRAMDDAPKGSVMIHVGLCTHVDEWGPLPLFGHTVDGNQNGRTAIDEQLALIRQQLKPPALTMISDRGTFSVGHLLRLQAEHYHGLCSAPWGEFRELFDQHRQNLTWKQASYLSLEQQRRRQVKSELPQEHYELAVVRHELTDDVTKQTIACRVIFVFSTADQQVVRKQRQKRIDTIRDGLEKTQRNLSRGGPKSDEASVTRRIAKLLDGRNTAKYFTWKLVELTSRQRDQFSSPGRGCRRPTHRMEFTFDEKMLQHDEQYDGYSVVVTTVPPSQGSADTLFTKYKQQNYSEQINHGFKGPLAVRPVFLHTPERVEALVFLLMAVLMAYYLLQRIYRQTIPAGATQKEQRTTARTILQAFSTYTLLIHRTPLGREVQPTRLTTRQREILQQIGFATPAQFFSKRLPRPPT
jgi:transposase